jgi:hypothetical protein
LPFWARPERRTLVPWYKKTNPFEPVEVLQWFKMGDVPYSYGEIVPCPVDPAAIFHQCFACGSPKTLHGIIMEDGEIDILIHPGSFFVRMGSSAQFEYDPEFLDKYEWAISRPLSGSVSF